MVTATASGAQTQHSPAPYPEDSDAKVRQIADIFGRNDILQLLDDMRTKLLGNVLSVQKLAEHFATVSTLADARADIGVAVQVVSGTWSGRAASQFNTYTNSVNDALDKQNTAVGAVSSILTELTNMVVDTYATAIKFLGTCAAELAKIDLKLIIAAVTSVIPVVDMFTAGDVIDTVVEAFGTLVKDFVDLLADSESKMSDFWGKANTMVRTVTDFPEIPELPGGSGIDNQRQWRVDPSAWPE
ncbi:hypothetical protein [Amycolatopsis sp. SID8362]|uniref:hypothetical protein n=1 Tax=Amycolatopsis sp. SID8362 TaxID=2690346 RepID=UPI001370C713|nr:hypothetical protein [Amycolatopsis sp. SID8362]NBH09751.1 hypothetical protein [Amycolatopsis sp. SID8362]NED46444.1 hypothetical protein [Amycolatopsis sp. SID8362]